MVKSTFSLTKRKDRRHVTVVDTYHPREREGVRWVERDLAQKLPSGSESCPLYTFYRVRKRLVYLKGDR